MSAEFLHDADGRGEVIEVVPRRLSVRKRERRGGEFGGSGCLSMRGMEDEDDDQGCLVYGWLIMHGKMKGV
jgi:hypothetical protein